MAGLASHCYVIFRAIRDMRPPCDEAEILAGSCGEPAIANGSWILAATILGSSMAFIDSDSVR